MQKDIEYIEIDISDFGKSVLSIDQKPTDDSKLDLKKSIKNLIEVAKGENVESDNY